MSFRRKFELKKLSQNRNNHIFYFTDSKKTWNLNQDLKNLPKFSNIIIRYYDKSFLEKKLILQKIISSNSISKQSIFIGKDPALSLDLNIRAIHFSDLDFKKNLRSVFLEFHKLKKINFKTSMAIHSIFSLKLLKIIKPDVVFLSPIFSTTTHNFVKTFGFYNFIKFKKVAEYKFGINNILPLGGINLQNLARLNKIKIKGFGAIDFFNNL